MEKMVATWAMLSPGRQFVILAATLSVFVAVFMLSRGVGERDMSLLYGGLEGASAAEILTFLEQQGVAHNVRGNAIYVETAQRDALRLTLAGQGLPASGGEGYELLDNLSGFATTSQMFDAAYWRAKEGELARTIVANPLFRTARVHISATGNQPFRRESRPTAAVTVHANLGSVSPAQVNALQFLIASAVSGLDPTDVAVIDHSGGLLSNAEGNAGSQVNDDRAETLRARAERVLAARVGAGNAVVEVTMETVTDTETISERIFDPESRVAISTDVQETAEKSEDSRGGDVTVASNVPDGDAAAAAGAAANENSETRSLTNYEVSETQRDILRGPGAVKRLTIAVLVNEVTTTDANGQQVIEARTPEELADLQELVESAVGFDADRGDNITLRAMAFEPLPALGTEASIDAATGAALDMMQLIQIGVLAAVAVILGLFVVRPILAGAPSVAALPPPDGDSFGSDDLGDDGPPMMSAFPDMMAIDGPDAGGMAMGTMGMGDMGGGGDDPVGRLRQLINEREPESLQILENWMDESPTTESA